MCGTSCLTSGNDVSAYKHGKWEMNTSASAVHRSEGDAHQCDWDIARCAVYREKAVLEEIAPHLRAGTIIVDMSTIGPVTTDALAGSQRGAASNSPTPPLDDLPSMRTVVSACSWWEPSQRSSKQSVQCSPRWTRQSTIVEESARVSGGRW